MRTGAVESFWPTRDESPVIKTVPKKTALSHASFAFDKVPADFESMREYHKARASYFKKAYSSLRDKFNSHVQDIVKKMNAALPAQVKEANKKA